MRRLFIALGGVIAAFFFPAYVAAEQCEAGFVGVEGVFVYRTAPDGMIAQAESACVGRSYPDSIAGFGQGVEGCVGALNPPPSQVRNGVTYHFVEFQGCEVYLQWGTPVANCTWAYETASGTGYDFGISLTSSRTACEPEQEQACEATKGKSEFVRITGEQMTPVRIGIEGCAYELLLPGFCMPTVGGNSNDVCGGVYRGTGEEYQGGALPGGSEPEPMPPGDDQICATGERGNTVCVERPDPDSGRQCGTMNGQPMCLDTLPKSEGDCRYVNGTWACGGDQSDVPKPPDPDAPVDDDGTPAEGDTINITNNNTVNNNIDNSKTTIGRGSRAGTGDGDQNDGEPGTCTDNPATPQNECGNLVKIDESGTPEGQERADELVGDGGLGDAMDEYIEQIGQPLGDEFTDVPEWNWSFGGGGSCQPIPWSFGGSSGGWDGYCDFWEGDVKPVLNWFFTFLTALHVWGVWRTANRGV